MTRASRTTEDATPRSARRRLGAIRAMQEGQGEDAR